MAEPVPCVHCRRPIAATFATCPFCHTPDAVITNQVANGVAVRWAVLSRLLGWGVPLGGQANDRREDRDG